jgi:hypothetical protein
MFCGWQLLSDYGTLTRVGNGILVVDVLGRRCRFNGEPCEALVMAKVLNSWMQEDLQAHRIPLEEIRKAVVQVEFTTTHTNTQQNLNQVCARPSKHFVLCNLNCRGRVVTDERTYEGQYRKTEEWPFEITV